MVVVQAVGTRVNGIQKDRRKLAGGMLYCKETKKYTYIHIPTLIYYYYYARICI